MLLIKAALLGLVEGLTEFLPISSTGHLILAASLLDFTGETAKVFEIAIQSGAMLAVVWEYRRRLSDTLRGLGSDEATRRFAINVAVAFVPAVVAGLPCVVRWVPAWNTRTASLGAGMPCITSP